MRFAPRVAVLAAAVGIPLGAVVATYALADEEPGPTVPAEVRIGESALSQEPAPQLPKPPTQPAPPPPHDQAPAEVVPPPPPIVDDDDDGYQNDNDDRYQDDDDD